MRITKFERSENGGHPDGAGNNICGVLVHAAAKKQQAVSDILAARPGVEVHHLAPNGRIVLTVEDTKDAWASATIADFHWIDGVLSVSLVYHHFESGNLEEEMSA